MQANRDSSSMERRKEGLNNLTINDTKDTGAPSQDAEIIISLFNPFREKLATYHGYEIRHLQSNFRSISVLKNRYGEADVEDCVAFYGKIGFFKEIPKPDEINDYSKFQTTDWLVKGDNGIENIDDRKQTQNLICVCQTPCRQIFLYIFVFFGIFLCVISRSVIRNVAAVIFSQLMNR